MDKDFLIEKQDEEFVPVEDNNIVMTEVNDCNQSDREYTSKILNEVLVSLKDDRLKTKKAIDAQISLEDIVQRQNKCFIDACENELRTQKITMERRKEILDKMKDAIDQSSQVHVQSMKFRKEELDHLHQHHLLVVGSIAAVVIVTAVIITAPRSKAA